MVPLTPAATTVTATAGAVADSMSSVGEKEHKGEKESKGERGARDAKPRDQNSGKG
jgi:hypothetical protein